jgi:hypothetical protein
MSNHISATLRTCITLVKLETTITLNTGSFSAGFEKKTSSRYVVGVAAGVKLIGDKWDFNPG